jgi:ApaG protein
LTARPFPSHGKCVSEALTKGIRISVRSQYLEDRSQPESHQFAFAYTIRIRNEGAAAAQLLSRHWVITDGLGHVEEVRGDGVVGVQPTLEPGQSFEYSSGCILETPHGTMHGTYRMQPANGEHFEAEIAPFLLAQPGSLN